MTFIFEKTHPHASSCENFETALRLGLAAVINGEPQIVGRLSDDQKVGNIETGEKYDPKNFMLNFVIRFCPFCGKKIYEYPDEEDVIGDF